MLPIVFISSSFIFIICLANMDKIFSFWTVPFFFLLCLSLFSVQQHQSIKKIWRYFVSVCVFSFIYGGCCLKCFCFSLYVHLIHSRFFFFCSHTHFYYLWHYLAMATFWALKYVMNTNNFVVFENNVFSFLFCFSIYINNEYIEGE